MQEYELLQLLRYHLHLVHLHIFLLTWFWYHYNLLVQNVTFSQDDYSDTRNKLVKKYADEPDTDGNVKVAEVHIPAFTTAMEELMGEEFEVSGIKPIKFPEGLKLSPIEMGLLEEVVDMSAFLDDEGE